MKTKLFGNLIILALTATLFSSCGSKNSEEDVAAGYTSPYANGYNGTGYGNNWNSNASTSTARTAVQSAYTSNQYAASGNVTVDNYSYNMNNTNQSWLGGLIQFNASFSGGWGEAGTSTIAFSSFGEGYTQLITESFDNPGFSGYVGQKQSYATMTGGYNGAQVYEIMHVAQTQSQYGNVTHEIRIVIDLSQPAAANPVEKSYMVFDSYQQVLGGQATIKYLSNTWF